jgi:hypothetical protein
MSFTGRIRVTDGGIRAIVAPILREGWDADIGWRFGNWLDWTLIRPLSRELRAILVGRGCLCLFWESGCEFRES